MNANILKDEDVLAAYMVSISKIEVKEIAKAAQVLSDKMPDNEKLTYMAQNLADALKKSAESANNEISMKELSKRQKQILACMQQEKSYSTEEIAQMIGLKAPRTRQLLNELAAMDLVSCTAATKNRRYVKK